MENQDIRWKQRFQNFESALALLRQAVAKKSLSDLEKAGLIQIYEFTFELALKTLKDFLEDKKVGVKYPRDTIREGFYYELIRDGDIWMDMLQKRNLMSHTYNEKNAELTHRLIVNQYFSQLQDFYETLRKEL